jgi:hypothetical protein
MKHLLLTVAVVIGLSGSSPTWGQTGCPYLHAVTVECMDDQPKCDQKHTIQECSGILYSTECCNGNENQVRCCSDTLTNAGYNGVCPDGGAKNCTFGLWVINPDNNKTQFACVTGQRPFSRVPKGVNGEIQVPVPSPKTARQPAPKS